MIQNGLTVIRNTWSCAHLYRIAFRTDVEPEKVYFRLQFSHIRKNNSWLCQSYSPTVNFVVCEQYRTENIDKVSLNHVIIVPQLFPS